MLRFTLNLLITLVFTLLFGWAAMALWFDSAQPILCTSLLLIVLGTGLVLLKVSLQRVLFCSILFIAVLTWWLGIEPSNSRNWQADVSRLPSVDISGDTITFHNVRNFEYRSETDFTPHWESRSYKLSDLSGADLYFSDWGAAGIAHTIVSWDFGPGQHLAVSIETRKKVGDTYSAIRGFFRQYELYYVLADERDVIGLRAKYRGEKLHLYRISLPIDVAHKILKSYIDNINHLVDQPEWYNALTSNCTTSIRLNVQKAGAAKPLSWRHLANKHLPKLLYDYKTINTDLPFDELEKLSDITEVAKAAVNNPKFSEIIRQNLPPRLPAPTD